MINIIKKIKIFKILTVFYFIGFFILTGYINSFNVLFEPTYQETRFEPKNTIHAGCNSSANIYLNQKPNQKPNNLGSIKEINIVMQYNPNEIEIYRIIPENKSLSGLNYKINYDNIFYKESNILEYGDDLVLFRINFQSNEFSTGTKIDFITGSYIVFQDDSKLDLLNSYYFPMGKPQECNPDITPPNIKLVSPQNNSKDVFLDSEFIFELYDIGKGIDKNSLELSIDGELYTSKDIDNISWSGNLLYIYPNNWFPVDKQINLNIKVSDKQVYGGSNTKIADFYVFSSTGVNLKSKISPNKLRAIAGKLENIRGTKTECNLLFKIDNNANKYYKNNMKKIMQKMGCLELDNNQETQEEFLDIYNEQSIIDEDTNKQYKNNSISILALLGWILFLITLLLKTHYYISYKKYKKLNKANSKTS